METIIKYILIIILGLFVIYLLSRLVGYGFAKSLIQAILKQKNLEEDKNVKEKK